MLDAIMVVSNIFFMPVSLQTSALAATIESVIKPFWRGIQAF
jgi:hypothetical protein